MQIRENLQTAFLNLKANKTRSLLSMMGVVIGTGAVIVVISIVNGSRQATLDQMKAGKEDMLVLRVSYSESSGRFGKITLEDVERIKSLPHVTTAFPDMVHETEARGTFGKTRAMLIGVDHHYTALYKHNLAAGRFFGPDDTAGRPHIAVVSDKMAEKLFGLDDPIGQRLRLEIGTLRVVGVFKAEERLRRMDQNADVMVPLYTLVQMLKSVTIYAVQVRAEPGQTEAAKTLIRSHLEEKGTDMDTIDIYDVREFQKDVEKWARSWMLQMSLIAGISLLVGGIGLMNVMLTTVAERTHEIGIRKAVGASSQAILHQFLIESIALSGLGGAIGIALGLVLTFSLNVLTQGKILVAVLPISLIGSMFFSLFIGMVFGLYPASKAAHMSPVESLRYE